MVVVEVENYQAWRQHARALVANMVPPDQVQWHSSQQGSLFSAPQLSLTDSLSTQAKLNTAINGPRVPKQFLSMAVQAACFEDSDNPTRKWSVFYSLLWRMNFECRNVLSLKSDAQVQYLQSMTRAVSRDMHKMKAFVRFQSNLSSVEVFAKDQSVENSYYTAWFEPAHSIVEAIAPFFVKRFTGMSWSILTPRGCAHWNQQELKLSPGTVKPSLKADEFEGFWKAYYCSIFNPSRLKEKAMMAEMPKKYWKYLPEASCIKDLCRDAGGLTEKMIESASTRVERARDKSASISEFQDNLRQTNRT
jgi:DNA polymerase